MVTRGSEKEQATLTAEQTFLNDRFTGSFAFLSHQVSSECQNIMLSKETGDIQ